MGNWLEGKHILILGASGRVGIDLSKQLMGKCDEITLVSRNVDNRLRNLEAELSKIKSKTKVNIRITDVVINPYIEISNLYCPNKQIDALVYCVGGSPCFEILENMHLEEIQEIININLMAPIFWLNSLLPIFKKIKTKNNKRAHVIILSSRSGERGSPMLSVYSAAKGGMELFVDAVRKEYARHDIVFSLINPGGIKAPYFSEKWSKERKAIYNKQSMDSIDAVQPIISCLQWDFATNKISYESVKQWHHEQGILC